ncbi:trehalose-phosphatase [Variovorax terrae]|uniref:Trehalose 6-phosphate phosphatase n=1 Tax=Variovorax terrae TaxID=2923278 RepID=A0A9X1VWU0_9BURK|nr:trehalose-phosphatase [Variovorax terrae]MCJ0764668.1 trehalose-phosphatase [Variovorax terrae]
MNFVDILCPSCALFLDFDGTLVDLAPQPEAVRVPAGLVDSLEALAGYLDGALAVISGRPIAQIDAYLFPLRLPAAGVHGAERRGADGALALLPTVPLERVEQAARALAQSYPALRVEFKRGSVALHYRQAPALENLCLEALQAAVADSPGLTLLRGKMVVEAKPGGASKGLAIEAFLREPPFAGRTPVFAGDDLTDEVGFSTVQRLGGLGVKIGSGASVAWHRLGSAAALRHELAQAALARTGKALR